MEIKEKRRTRLKVKNQQDKDLKQIFKNFESKLACIDSYVQDNYREGNYKEIRRLSVLLSNQERQRISYYGAVCDVDLKYFVKLVNEY